jgi:hypothetical protein
MEGYERQAVPAAYDRDIFLISHETPGLAAPKNAFQASADANDNIPNKNEEENAIYCSYEGF